MRRRRINLTKESLNKWFVKMRRRYLKIKGYNKIKGYSIKTINNEFD